MFQFIGGVPFATVQYLDIPMDDTMPPLDALNGIIFYHSFETSNEGIQMWHVAGMVTGKLLQCDRVLVSYEEQEF